MLVIYFICLILSFSADDRTLSRIPIWTLQECSTEKLLVSNCNPFCFKTFLKGRLTLKRFPLKEILEKLGNTPFFPTTEWHVEMIRIVSNLE